MNEVILRGHNLSLKCCQSLELLIYRGLRYRNLRRSSIGSVGQRAAKLAVKVGGHTKKSADLAITAEVGLTPLEAKSFSKFDGL